MAKFGISAKLLMFSAIIFAGYAFLAWLASHKIHQTITSERIEMVHMSMRWPCPWSKPPMRAFRAAS